MNPSAAAPRALRHSARRPGAAVLVLAVLCLPALSFYLGLTTSFAGGLALCLVGLLAMQRPALRGPIAPILAIKAQIAIAAVTPLLLLHLLVAALRGQVDLPRALGSIVLLGVLLAGARALANGLLAVPDARFHAGLLKVFALMCGMALLGTLGWGPPTLAADPWRRPVFPFSEPSTFALSFVPVLMYVCVATRDRARIGWVLLGLACSAVIQNLTLLCGTMLVAMVVLRVHLLAVLAFLVAAAASQFDLSYFVDRLDFSEEASNLSTLVYMQGWQMVVEALQRTGGFGLGFQQLGVQGTDVDASQLIRALRDGEDMNLLDGGFAFAKLGGDFGAIGIALGLLYVSLAMRSALILRAVAAGRRTMPPVLVLAHASVLTFALEMFVRSTGYFSGTALLFAASLWLVLRRTAPAHAQRRAPARKDAQTPSLASAAGLR